MSATSSVRSTRSPLADAAHFVRCSRSIASMLPSLLQTGVVVLVMTAVMRLVWVGYDQHFFGVWMETWLTAWPIAFPIAYLSGPSMVKVAAFIAAPAARMQAHEPRGLAVVDIKDASARATGKNDLKVLRKRIRTFEVA